MKKQTNIVEKQYQQLNKVINYEFSKNEGDDETIDREKKYDKNQQLKNVIN